MEANSESSEKTDSVFVWDENSQLYFHASSGFYHDPSAGWYYSSRDDLYYKFENGNYVLLGNNKVDDGKTHMWKETTLENPTQDGSSEQVYDNNNGNYSASFDPKFEAYQQRGNIAHEAAFYPIDCTSSPACEKVPPPPSEWLEDTLIDLYLSGYNNPAVSAADAVTVPLETDHGDSSELAADVYSNAYELEEGEWIPEDEIGVADTSCLIDEDEEKWQAQYGQVIESGKELVSEFPIMDLWDWEMVIGSRKDGKGTVARVLGRPVKQTAKLHPSMPSRGGKLKSAPICEIHLDLVRVKTGQVYRLRNPSARYLASLLTYDSADPTKDWGFPQLSSDKKTIHLFKSHEGTSSAADVIPTEKDLSKLPSSLSLSEQKNYRYRDRAAERRLLHGGFGVGPGQKNLVGSLIETPSSPVDSCPQEAAAEALEISFGARSYGRKILQGMGWKEGEGLGSSSKGTVEPVKPVGNVGNAGLGWPHRR